jgi:hypothetical protein
MPRNKKLLQTKYQRIKDKYKKLSGERIHGVQKYSYVAILKMLENEFLLTADYK